jgi:TolB-like protein/Flp pilus assembly protein TadD
VNNLFQELRRRNVVRVAGVYVVVGWVLVQIATTLEESIGLPSWFDGLIVALLLIGLPVALIFAWAFELTPDGVVRTADVAEGESITRRTGRRLDYAIILGIVALAVIMLWRDSADDAPAPETPPAATVTETSADAPEEPAVLDKSIAVLPFENRSPNPDDAYFAAGVHDDLLTHLSKIRDMHVISRTSVMGYADTDRRIPDIGRELGVATVMEGAVQRAGNRVRINVQLIDAKSDAHLWAEIYDRELTADNLFDIQSEITRAIADALHSVLSSGDEEQIEGRPTSSVAAYDAYIKGRLQLSIFSFSLDRYRNAIGFFDRAIELDPNFAEAYAQKAFSLIGAYWFVGAGTEWRERALQALQKAEQIAPNAVETLTARGYYHYWGFRDYTSATQAFSQALATTPNFIQAITGDAFARRRAGEFDAAVAGLERAIRLDPRNFDAVMSLAETYALLGNVDGAREVLQAVPAIEQESGVDLVQWSMVVDSLGDAEAAWQVATKSTPAKSPALYQSRVRRALATRDPDKVRTALDEWPVDLRRPYEAPETYEVARARALLFLGEEEEAKRIAAEVKARLDASDNPYPQGWLPNAYFWPIEVPALTGDLEALRAAVADYKFNAQPDAWSDLQVTEAIAGAFARAGDPDAAFEYIAQLNEMLGPWTFAYLSIRPDLDPLHDDPRWRALELDYQSWAAQ